MTTARRAVATPTPLRPPATGLRWFEPSKQVASELVFYGDHGARLELLIEEWAATKDFLEAGVDAPTRMIFTGPSGSGKSLSARWLGYRMNLPVAIAAIGSTVGSHLGETAGNLSAIFQAATSIDCILFLDELDGISRERGSGGESSASHEEDRTTTALLQELDWCKPHQLLIAATNHADLLDPAVRRRLTEEVVFGPPGPEARKQMIDRWLAKASVPEEEIAALVEATGGVCGAELRTKAMELGRAIILERRRCRAAKAS